MSNHGSYVMQREESITLNRHLLLQGLRIAREHARGMQEKGYVPDDTFIKHALMLLADVDSAMRNADPHSHYRANPHPHRS